MSLTQSTFDERQQIDIGVIPQSLTADTAVTGSWYPMEGRYRVAGVGQLADVTADDTLEVQLRQATDSSGSDAKDLGSVVTATSGTTGDDLLAIAEANVSDMDVSGGFTHVAVQIESSEAKSGSALMIREGTYRP